MSEVVAVTGASAGLGRAIAVEFATHGASVGLIARGGAGLEGAAKDVEAAGGTAHLVQADVADPDQLEAAAREIEEQLGELDVWVNNAMATVYAPLWQLTPDEFRRVTDVTYLGSVWGFQTALRRFRPRNRGTIVQVGSALAYRGIPIQSAYCGAKHALNGVIDSIRTELLHEGSDVHVSVVQMPGLNTPQFTWGRNKLDEHPQPMPPIFQPEVGARAVYHAAHNERRELWVGYSTAGTVLGNRLAGGLLDRYLARNAVAGQKTGQETAPSRPDNLFEPQDDHVDAGTHGPFDGKAKERSLYALAARHPLKTAAGGLALAAAAGLTQLVRRGGGQGPWRPWRER